MSVLFYILSAIFMAGATAGAGAILIVVRLFRKWDRAERKYEVHS